MHWFGDHAWAAWLVAAFALSAAEMASLDLVLLMLAIGALGGVVAAVVTGQLVVQFAAFAVVSLAMLGVVRPNLVRRLHGGPELKLGATHLIGQEAVVRHRITAQEPARIKIGGEDWSAKPYDPGMVIEPGTTIVVLEIKGATAYVHPLPSTGELL